MSPRYFQILFIALLCFSASCFNESASEYTDVEAVVLDEYEELVLQKSLLLEFPVNIKYDEKTDHLFIHDLGQQKILELNDSKGLEEEYGRKGRGPGELQNVDNFFIRKNHIYIVDPSQFFIHKYDRNGDFISSFEYGEMQLHKKFDAHRPPAPPIVDNNNEPYITLNENVLLPSRSQGESLYQLMDWQGNHLAGIGEIQEGYSSSLEGTEALANRKVPPSDLNLAFPVIDRSNPGELFIIYSAIPKIAKYDTTGIKLWERKIPQNPEIDSLVTDLQSLSEYYSKGVLRRLYVSGTSGPQGALFLTTYTNLHNPLSRPMWIHQFDSKGELIRRYKIESDSDLSYYPGIDFKDQQIFVTPSRGLEIRSYRYPNLN